MKWLRLKKQTNKKSYNDHWPKQVTGPRPESVCEGTIQSCAYMEDIGRGLTITIFANNQERLIIIPTLQIFED